MNNLKLNIGKVCGMDYLLEDNGKEIAQITNANTKYVSVCQPDKKYVAAIKANELIEKENIERAEFICKAVNLHSELIEALQNILNCNPDNLTAMNNFRRKGLLTLKKTQS